MERRKLTKEDIDKVRDIEGFPIGTDEDIIALSDAPYYTACPNPFIEDFIKEYGTPYDEATDDYHCEPFAADVSEGKYDPLYKLHSYPTKVPHKAIMRYINHYTRPGDIVFDGFCGTGMTGVAAQSCGLSESILDMDGTIGNRNAILCDLSPTATYIASNYVTTTDLDSFYQLVESTLDEAKTMFDWMNMTYHGTFDYKKKPNGHINYTVWSRVYICPKCGHKFPLWNVTTKYDYEKAIGKVTKTFKCPNCNLDLDVSKAITSMLLQYDNVLGKVIEVVEQVPVLINYTYAGKRYEKTPDDYDLKIIKKVQQKHFVYFVPHREIPYMHQTHQRNNLSALGITHEHHLYTEKSLHIYSYLFNKARNMDAAYRNRFMFLMSACFNRTTRLVRYMAQYKEKNVGPLSGTLYFPTIFGEINVIDNILARFEKLKKAYAEDCVNLFENNRVLITTQSTNDLRIPSNTIDYIFVDPPFGDNLMYSELNYFTDMWLKVYENSKEEAIINKAQSKELFDYQRLMEKCFEKMYDILKPGRWITIEFHNSQNAVWNAIQETVQRAGFIVADVRTLDKGKGTTKQMVYTSAVKQDLIITAYKPKDSFTREFCLKVGSDETAWEFVKEHLSHVPIAIDADKNGRLDVIAERQAFLLFDRMVAYHIMQGIAVPLDATDFYKGLDERFLKRDGMYFLPNQVNAYDMIRATTDVETVSFSLFVSNEKTAIGWLYQQLDVRSGNGPQTYQDLMPKFLQELKAVDKHEKMPELAIILEENFLKDEDGCWYIPDLTKSGDIAKLREKNLLKEFQEYQVTKGKLKKFRSEAIRVGFSKLWKAKDYKAIVTMAERLPEETIQEDPNLLMYYDISLGRI